ncbi:uncharacterized protein LOC130295181 isoform X3 [Hyla sarda]|uniref:uncharacterized protein LOC130295181 isoform X3 n=1 Tax=Hyla sarda TaxID=327740 RepID=UPI0024C26210|nr:uncharacterized protein LOC130295181 isoform X3 [Hyla sarda]
MACCCGGPVQKLHPCTIAALSGRLHSVTPGPSLYLCLLYDLKCLCMHWSAALCLVAICCDRVTGYSYKTEGPPTLRGVKPRLPDKNLHHSFKESIQFGHLFPCGPMETPIAP